MRRTIKLIPRFHYTFSFIDLIFSFQIKDADKTDFRKSFLTDQVYFLNSARTGIYLLLKSLSQNKPLRVGIQPFTCPTVFRAIKEAGCLPVFIDINSNFTINTDDLNTKKDFIDLIIVTHTFGIPADMDRICEIMSGKMVFEDCAHAFLSEYKSKQCGTWGDASFFSMNYGKFPSIGSGGFVLINNPQIKESFEYYYNKLPDPDFLSSIIQPFKNLIYSIAFKPWIYGLITFPLFKKMDKKYDFIGKETFKPQKGFAVNRNVFFRNLVRYFQTNKVRKEKSLQLLSKLPSDSMNINMEGNNFYLFPIRREDRDQIYQKLLHAGFESGKHFAKSIEWAVKYGYEKGSCPVAEKVADKILTLPNVYWLNDCKMEKIVSILSSHIVV